MSNEKVIELKKMLPRGAIKEIAKAKGVTREWAGSVLSGIASSPDVEEYIKLAESKVIEHIDTLKKAWSEYQEND